MSGSRDDGTRPIKKPANLELCPNGNPPGAHHPILSGMVQKA